MLTLGYWKSPDDEVSAPPSLVVLHDVDDPMAPPFAIARVAERQVALYIRNARYARGGKGTIEALDVCAVLEDHDFTRVPGYQPTPVAPPKIYTA